MSINYSFARGMRLRRLHRHGDRRLFIVPLDHSITDGPLVRNMSLDHLVGQLTGNGVDAVVLHKGSLRHVSHRWFTDASLIVHLSASTRHAPDPNAKYLVSSVEESLRIGADAVSMHVNMGSLEERRQITDLAAVADACDRWNVPLLAMMYPRGPEVRDPRDPELLAHAATLAADLGADIVKSVYAGSAAEMRDVVRAVPVPLVVAGGPPLPDVDAVTDRLGAIMRSGVAGVAMGRTVFQAADPGAMARAVSRTVHQDTPLLVPSVGELDVAAG